MFWLRPEVTMPGVASCNADVPAEEGFVAQAVAQLVE